MLTWYAQEHVASCVAACVRMVLSGFGQFTTEQRIRQVLGNPLSGLSLDQAYQRIVSHGADVALHADWGLIDLRDCLREGWRPIIGVERRYLGHPDALHAVVLIEIDSHSVQALDPLGSSIPETITPEIFESAWISAGQQALVIKSPFPL
ncbi:MAG: cysteine peptidase family C39 domain-containing protein [Blastocatellia bacterium]